MIIHIQKSLSFKFLRIIAKRTDFAQRNFYNVHWNQLLQVALGHWQWGFLYSGSVVQLVSFFVLFFTPIPCTYTNLPLDGMARNYIIFYLPGYARSHN